MHDAVVVGSGPNGLAAALTLALAGKRVVVFEAERTPGGGARTAQLTLPGFVHDICSTVHPLGRGSPFFRALDLERHGLRWLDPSAPLAHVLTEEHTVLLEQSIDATVDHLGRDGESYGRLLGPLAEGFDSLMRMFLGPLLRMPEDPALFASFGLEALRSMQGLARAHFEDDAAPALLGGIAAHAMLPLSAWATSSFALVLAAAGHAVGWPVARGGSGAITGALVAALQEAGGELVVGERVSDLRNLPPARTILLDVTPRHLLSIVGDALPARYRRRLARYRYGVGVFKMDWALSRPVPWRDPACGRATTVHIGGSLEEIHAAESTVHRGRVAREPFLLFVQPTVADPERAPAGHAVGWAYCHVPAGFDGDLSELVEARIERFAPGFKRSILARASRNAVQMEQHNPNYVGGDINGGLANLSQLFFRPVARLDPYSTPNPRLFMCSSATPPGGGVHGLCGYWAAQSVLKRLG